MVGIDNAWSTSVLGYSLWLWACEINEGRHDHAGAPCNYGLCRLGWNVLFALVLLPLFLWILRTVVNSLAIVDFFHPKHFAALTEESKLLAGINGIARISFAVLFLLVRAVYFPYVYASMLVPDLFELLGKPYQVSQQKTKMMWMIFGASTSLTLLQLYWAKLVMVQVIKLLFPGNEKKAK